MILGHIVYEYEYFLKSKNVEKNQTSWKQFSNDFQERIK
jgi:hypothetical protein